MFVLLSLLHSYCLLRLTVRIDVSVVTDIDDHQGIYDFFVGFALPQAQ